jgi:hypothetical protein
MLCLAKYSHTFHKLDVKRNYFTVSISLYTVEK